MFMSCWGFRGFFSARIKLVCAVLFMFAAAVSASPQSAKDTTQNSTQPAAESKAAMKKVVREGIAVEFDLEPIDAQKKKAGIVEAGDTATFRFTITDTTTGTRLTGLHPAAWMDARRNNEESECAKKITNFLSANLLARPQLDFNAYYVLALNSDATISVVDPLFH